MNKIPPAALTNEIARSAAAQMAEYDHAEKMKKCGKRPDITNFIPRRIAEKILRDTLAEMQSIGCDLSSAADMTGCIIIKRLLEDEDN